MSVSIIGKNSEYVFNRSYWDWRPILAICEKVIEDQKLNYNTEYWGYNDGAGLENQEQCDKLANGMVEYVKNLNYSDLELVYVNSGTWRDMFNDFVYNNDITIKLNKEYPIGQVLLNPIICEDGEIYYPSHKTTILNVKQFIEFLHYCEGFNIT